MTGSPLEDAEARRAEARQRVRATPQWRVLRLWRAIGELVWWTNEVVRLRTRHDEHPRRTRQLDDAHSSHDSRSEKTQVSLPLGHRIDGEFVCMDCLRSDDHDRERGIGNGSAVDERVGSGKECSRCERRMPYLATVRLLPDGYSSIRAPANLLRGVRKAIRMEREEKVLIDQHALVYVSIGCQREVGIKVTPHGKIEVWVHDDPYADGDEPSKRWEYDPNG